MITSTSKSADEESDASDEKGKSEKRTGSLCRRGTENVSRSPGRVVKTGVCVGEFLWNMQGNCRLHKILLAKTWGRKTEQKSTEL